MKNIKPNISQSDFYNLPVIKAAIEIQKRTPRNHPDNIASFKVIVSEMEKYNIPAKAKLTLQDY